MCRKCFNSYNRCATLLRSLKDNACTAMQVFSPSMTPSTSSMPDIAPAPKRMAVASSSRHESSSLSPDVQVKE